MKIIQSKSFTRIASDFKRQPGSIPGENYLGQSFVFNRKKCCPKRKSKCKGLDTGELYPTNTVYQHGIDSPILERRQTGML